MLNLVKIQLCKFILKISHSTSQNDLNLYRNKTPDDWYIFMIVMYWMSCFDWHIFYNYIRSFIIAQIITIESFHSLNEFYLPLMISGKCNCSNKSNVRPARGSQCFQLECYIEYWMSLLTTMYKFEIKLYYQPYSTTLLLLYYKNLFL